jgi:hypothetical protein
VHKSGKLGNSLHIDRQTKEDAMAQTILQTQLRDSMPILRDKRRVKKWFGIASRDDYIIDRQRLFRTFSF